MKSISCTSKLCKNHVFLIFKRKTTLVKKKTGLQQCSVTASEQKFKAQKQSIHYKV